MTNRIISWKNEKYACVYNEGTSRNKDIVFVYFHGLEGKAKIVKPLLNVLEQYDFFSMEQRGHTNSLQKRSVSVKKHDEDISNIVKYFKSKYKQVYLIGESMGAAYISRYAFKHSGVDGVFCWSIPFEPKDIMIEKRMKKSYIIFRTILTYFTSINYSYKAKINYPLLTNSPFLLKLNEMETETIRQTSEAVALWKSSFKVKKDFINKKPKSPIYYWHGDKDFMTSKKTISQIARNKKIFFRTIPNSKHILMFEENADQIFKKIISVVDANNEK